MLKPSDKIIKAKQKKQWVTASAIISFILVLIGAATLILIQKPIKESQDLRQQASIVNGQVQVSFSPGDTSTLNVSEETQVDYQVTTNSVQTDGLQFVFNVVTDTLGAAPEFILTDTANLQIAYQQAEQVTDGYLVSVILIGSQISSPVSYSSPSSIGYLRFTPQSTGTIEVNFDVENSLSTVFNSNPPEDQLNNIATLNYTVVDPTQASPTPSPTASSTSTPTDSPSPSPSATPEVSPSPVVSPTPGVSPSPTAQVSPTPGVTPSVTPSPTPTSNPNNGTGGTTVASCNQSCSSNNDCQANHRCYNNQCRLVTNVSSSSCAAPSTADAGLNRSCNQYCADNRECGAGYNCYFNRCRNPLNLDSTSCAAPSQQVLAATFASCNQACNTHKDCAANLLCNPSSNTCRLATNPSSTSCTPTTHVTVSNMYAGGSKGGDKGGSASAQTPGSTTGTDTTNGGTTTTTGSTTTTTTTSTDDKDLPIKDQTAFDALVNYFNVQLAERNISLPLFFIMIGVGLLLLVFIVSMILRFLGGSRHQSPIITPIGADRDRKKDEQYENKLAQKINTLQHNQQTPSAAASTAPLTRPQPLPTNRPSNPSPFATTVPAPVVTPPQTTPSPVAQPNQPPQFGNSNMMDRLKNKGVTTPNTPEETN